MKTIKILATFALLCSLLLSCSKMEPEYGSSMWLGACPVMTENGTTGDPEEHTAGIFLSFSPDGYKCTMTQGIKDLYESSMATYPVDWSASDTFTLYSNHKGQKIQLYSGKIEGEKMLFEFLSCDCIERTFELTRVYTNTSTSSAYPL